MEFRAAKPDCGNEEGENWQASKFSGTPGRIQMKSLLSVVNQENEASNSPGTFTLSQNYPNPFNPATRIQYSIATAGVVTLKIYNMAGQEVETLVNDYQSSGAYTVKWNVRDIASDIYLYRLKAKDFIATKKLMVIK